MFGTTHCPLPTAHYFPLFFANSSRKYFTAISNCRSTNGLFVAAAFVTPFSWSRTAPLKDTARCARLAAVFLVFVTYAAGVLLYYASGRFRLPLAPLLCVLVAAPESCLGSVRRNWRYWFWPLGALVLTATNFFDARDQSTFIQDEQLSANAAAQVGNDAQAYYLA